MNTNVYHLKRRIITIFMATMLLLGCSMLLGSKTYATTAPTEVKAVGGYESISLTWKAPADAVKYQVLINDAVVADGLTTPSCKVPFDPYPTDGTANAKTATIKVIAFDAANTASEAAVVPNFQVIHPMYVVCQAKGGAKLYPSAKSKKAALTVNKGTQLIAYGGARQNGENKRVIIKMNGQSYFVKSSDLKIKKYYYDSKNLYSTEQVEAFVNDKGIDSNPKMGPKRMIWVDTYNQRVYLFAWNGKWVIDPKYPTGLKANTGKELSPFGIFNITSKWDVKTATGTKWWCIFNSVGIHEKLGDKLGKPASGGCIRIPDKEAKWFYYNIKKMTKVMVY